MTVDGRPTKLTRKQIEKYAGKGAFADQTVSQAKEALKAIKAREAELAERDSVWNDEDKLRAELEKRGLLDKVSLKRLQQKMAEQEMTPEQRRIAELEALQAESDKKLKASEEEKAQQRLSARAKHVQASISNELDSAWERAGFERGADAFYAVYEVMKDFSELGMLDPNQPFTSVIADRIIDAARENIDGTDKRREAAVLKGLKGEALVKRLGKSVVDEVLRHKVAELRGGGARKPAGLAMAAPAAPQQFMSPQDALKKMRGIG